MPQSKPAPPHRPNIATRVLTVACVVLTALCCLLYAQLSSRNNLLERALAKQLKQNQYLDEQLRKTWDMLEKATTERDTTRYQIQKRTKELNAALQKSADLLDELDELQKAQAAANTKDPEA